MPKGYGYSGFPHLRRFAGNLPYYQTAKFGLLFNWYAVTDARKITSSADWKVLTTDDLYADPVFDNYPRNQLLNDFIGLGGDLKETGTILWSTPNTGATNLFNFNAKPSGGRKYDGTFNYINEQFLMYLDYVGNSEAEFYYIKYDSEDLNFCYGVLLHDFLNLDTADQNKKNGFVIRIFRYATESEKLLADGSACDLYTGTDGKLYRTIKIGGMVIISDNLAETKYRNGDPIPEVTDNAAWSALTTGALCAYNNDWNNV